jgi:hypothetical protein
MDFEHKRDLNLVVRPETAVPGVSIVEDARSVRDSASPLRTVPCVDRSR